MRHAAMHLWPDGGCPPRRDGEGRSEVAPRRGGRVPHDRLQGRRRQREVGL